MLFVRLGGILAWGLLVLGVLRALMGFGIAFFLTDPAAHEAARAAYLGSRTAGEAIDQGLLAAALGVAFGLLTHIARRKE